MTDEQEKEPVAEQEAPAAENPYDFEDPYAKDAAITENDPGDEDDGDGDESEAEGDGEADEPEAQAEEPEKPKPQARKPEPEVDSDEEKTDDPSLDPRAFLDEELATKVFGIISEQQRKIAKLEEMLNGAGIMAPKEASISKVGERFPDVFGGKGASPTAEQSEARQRLSEAADILRSTYVKRGKAAPGWDDLLRVAMSVEFPDVASRAVAQEVKAKRRESQRIARPAMRETSLSREERAVRAARKLMLESAAFSSDVPELG
jgi:hypothetical protein